MNKTILAIALTATITGCATTPAHQNNAHSMCDAAYAKLKFEGPPLEQDLRYCLRTGFDLRDPKCFDNRRFNAFSNATRTVRTCLNAGLLRPSISDAAVTTVNLDNIAELAGRLGDMARAEGL